MLPKAYSDWTDQAKQRYQAVKKLASSLHDYIDVTDDIGHRVNAIIRIAESIDAGDGLMFEKAGNVIKKVFLTQTFH